VKEGEERQRQGRDGEGEQRDKYLSYGQILPVRQERAQIIVGGWRDRSSGFIIQRSLWGATSILSTKTGQMKRKGREGGGIKKGKENRNV
jgi:hypothetical protein